MALVAEELVTGSQEGRISDEALYEYLARLPGDWRISSPVPASLAYRSKKLNGGFLPCRKVAGYIKGRAASVSAGDYRLWNVVICRDQISS